MLQIAECSQLPISIIIAGVGDENFKLMHQLDDVNVIRKNAPENIKDQVRDIT